MRQENDHNPAADDAFLDKNAFVLAHCVILSLYLLAGASNIYLRSDAIAANLSWCATSVFLGALLRSRAARWISLTAIAVVGNLVAHWMVDDSTITATGAAIADIIETCIAAAAVKHLIHERDWYLSLRMALSLSCLSLLASATSTLFEFFWTAAFADAGFRPFAKVRSFTDALNLLVALPFVLSWTDPTLLRKLTTRKLSEIVLLTALSAFASYALLVSGTPFLFLTIPLLLVATLIGGILGSTAAVYGLSLVVRGFTLGGPAEIISIRGTEATASLVIYHLFVFTALLSSVPLGVLLGRLEHSAEQLREAGKVAEHARREAEAARDRAEKAGTAKSDFLSVMSHELRTPMTGVLGLIDLLSREDLTNRQMRYLENMRRSGRHLLEIINDILDFSKLETGKLEIECTTFSVQSVFENVWAIAQPLCDAKLLEFNANYSKEIPDLLSGDPTRLQQILLNLVGNAIKFTDRGLIKVTASRRPLSETALRLRFEVQDTGVGIAYEKQSEIFGAFTQEDRSIARRYGGSGLGLAICKRLVEAMGGEIGFTSAPGLGSIFYFEVPVSASIGDDVTSFEVEDNKDPNPCRILIAEDIALNRSILRSMLSVNGHILVFAQNGAEAVEWARRTHFDIILMDVQMPVMDGLEATRQIRALSGPSQYTPIVALTANVLEGERQRYLEAGMDVCVPKPIDWNILNRTIAQYVTGQTPVTRDTRHPKGIQDVQSSLVDSAKLQALREKLDNEIESLLIEAITYAERICEELQSVGFHSDSFSREMHALKGMAGMLGLTGMQRISGELEIGAGIDGSLESYEAELREIISATRIALAQLELLPAGEGSVIQGLRYERSRSGPPAVHS